MNRLKGMRTYLAGAMDRVEDGGKGWREKITPMLKRMGVIVINPCDKPADIAIEDSNTRSDIEELKVSGEFGKIRENYAIIRTLDLRCVDISDFLIVSIDLDVHACGTYEEISVANSQKKPVLVWCQQGKASAPNWLFFMLPHQHIFDSMENLMGHLAYVDRHKSEVEHYKRWFFFNKRKMEMD
jgi:hypothetical protein